MQLTHFIGCYQWTAGDGTTFLRFCYAARPLSHDPRSRWTPASTRAVADPGRAAGAGERQRSPLVWQVVADYLGGQRHPLSLVRRSHEHAARWWASPVA